MRRARYRRARRSGGARDARRSNEAAGRRRRKLAGASAPTDADDDATARRRRNRAGSQWARSVAPRGTRGDTKETRRAPRPQSERLQDVERDRGCARALRIAARRARSFLPSLARSSRFSSPRERSIDRSIDRSSTHCPFPSPFTGGRISSAAGSNLLGQQAQDRNQDATIYVGNLDLAVRDRSVVVVVVVVVAIPRNLPSDSFPSRRRLRLIALDLTPAVASTVHGGDSVGGVRPSRPGRERVRPEGPGVERAPGIRVRGVRERRRRRLRAPLAPFGFDARVVVVR